MAIKIGFEVISSSGEDEKFRACELNYHGPSVRGWRSSANAAFPQHLIIKLKVSAILHQIQMLAHQYLIPEKVEICTSSYLGHDDFKTEFEYLGFITFSDNKATGFRSRELKSIFIPAIQARYIKLVIHSNHSNGKNIYNQVALIAINVLGDPVQNSPEPNNNFPSNTYYSGSASCNLLFSPYDDLAFEMYVDQDTANLIKLLESRKMQAVQEEQFDYANALKITIKNLRAAGEILGLYEQEKKQAINREDYEKAKKKKIQMDRFREKIYSALDIQQVLHLGEVLGRHSELKAGEEEQKIITHESNITNIKNLNLRLQDEISNNNNVSNNKNCGRSSPRSLQENSLDKLFHSKSQNFISENQKTDNCLNSNYISASTSFPQQLSFYLNNSLEKGHVYRNVSELGEEYDEDLSSRSGSITSYSNSPNSSEKESSPYKKIISPASPSKLCESQSTYAFANQSSQQQKEKASRETCHVQDIKRSDSVSLMPPLRDFESKNKITISTSEYKINNKENMKQLNKSTFEAYEEKTLPALRSYHGNEVVRNCQFTLDSPKKSTLNEREKKQASLPISVFGVELIEKFYSKNFNDKEEGLKCLQQELRSLANYTNYPSESKVPSFNKIARAAIFLLHRALRDKVFSVYSLAAETVRLFFVEYVPQRVAASEVGRSVEKLFPELLLKSGDVMPRIHNMAAHTLLTMAECEEVRCLNIIPVHLSRPLTASIHPRLALSRLEMVEQLILSQGISKEKKSGLSCRTLAEFGSSGLDHPAEPVRKVSERILLEVYKTNPRIVRKQLPPDDNVTRRNLLYRHLFQKFDEIDVKRKLEESNCNGITEAHSTSVNEISKGCDSIYLKSEKNEIQSNKPTQNFKNIWEVKEVFKKETPKPPLVVKINIKNQQESRTQSSNSPRVKTDGQNFEKTHKNQKNSQLPHKTLSVVKFPSLTDSVDTTKARMLLNKKTNSKLKKMEVNMEGVRLEKKLRSGIFPEPIKNDRKKSSIPVPVALNLRKNPNTQTLRHDNLNLLPRPKLTNFRSKLPTKVGKEKASPIPTKILFEPLKGETKIFIEDKLVDSPENNDEGIVMEETAKLSDSMITSLREMESSLGYTTDDQAQTSFKCCIFCMSSKTWDTEEGLTNHYLNDCLMLTTCKYCRQVIEISAFTNHLLNDCRKSNLFLKCNDCQEAILKDSFEAHKCFVGDEKLKSRCPFCHKNIGDEDTCWREHLVENSACPNHPRKL